jgi:nitroimidazol reductase NimA-like FMN-containing flavoprotein (pyridoxamine 5'-phosphate oxidase superfamily)
MTSQTELEGIARRVIDDNLYMTLGTSGGRDQPWVTPVYYSARAYTDFYWLSGPEADHSRNIRSQPQVSIVIFDSQAAIGSAQAVYMSAVAEEITRDELARAIEIFSRESVERGGGEWTTEEVQPPAALRLYRAAATQQFILCPRKYGEPCRLHGRSGDHRTLVDLANDRG